MTADPLDRQCTAKSKRSGQRCRRAAIAGGSVCRMHGGGAPRVAAAAAARVVEARAAAAVRDLEGDPLGDPVAELLRVAGSVVRLEQWLRSEAEKLEKVETWAPGAGEEVRATLRAYERALDRSARVLVEINRLGLEEKRVVIAAAEVALLAAPIERFLARLELSPQQWELARVVVPEELERAAAGGGS